MAQHSTCTALIRVVCHLKPLNNAYVYGDVNVRVRCERKLATKKAFEAANYRQMFEFISNSTEGLDAFFFTKIDHYEPLHLQLLSHVI